MFPQVFGKYILERPLAAGGMARVYLATLRGAGGFEKRLVVKQIRAELATDEAFVRRFVAEAKTTVELAHPNIVPVYELGVEQGVYYLAMELCDGVTLAELLERTGALTIDEGAYVAVEICRALDYAHRKAQVVHRDVTPRNVIVDDEGGVRLIDFGIAAKAHADGREVFGSPGHMPPEQLRGEAVGPPADVFAVAALLYEAWSLVPPFRRATAEASAQALTEPPRPPSELGPELARLSPLDAHLLSALAPDKSARPQTAESFARPLRGFTRERDLGDVARGLAARVQRARRQPGASGPPPAHPEEARAAPATAASVATRTFAERSPSLEVATRRIAEDANGHAGSRPARATSWRARAAAAVGAGVVLGLLAVARIMAWRTTTSSAVEGPPLLVGSVHALPAETELTNAVGALANAPSSPTHERPPSAMNAPAVERAPGHLRVLASPPADVEVDGHARGAAPLLDIPVSAGMHVVRLYCAALDEAVTQQVRVVPGETVTVSADFTAPRGRLIVRRATR